MGIKNKIAQRIVDKYGNDTSMNCEKIDLVEISYDSDTPYKIKAQNCNLTSKKINVNIDEFEVNVGLGNFSGISQIIQGASKMPVIKNFPNKIAIPFLAEFKFT